MKMQAEMSMGLIHFGDEADRPKPDLRVARHSIDLLAMIADKTRGNLSIDEQRLIENSLTELRFRFVQASESSAEDCLNARSQNHRAWIRNQHGSAHSWLRLPGLFLERSSRQPSSAIHYGAVWRPDGV